MGEVKIVGPGFTLRGYPYPVCKKLHYRVLVILTPIVHNSIVHGEELFTV